MKKAKQLLSLFIVLVMTCSLLSITVSAADITLSKDSLSVTVNKKASVTVSDITDITVKSSSDFIAVASYSADTQKITITGKHYGTAKITVTSKKDKKVSKTISVNVKAPEVTGSWVTDEKEGFWRFKTEDGKFVKGWNTITDASGTNTYYFYPNGVLFNYVDVTSIMYNNQAYGLKNFAATGKKGTAYVLSPNPVKKTSITKKTSAKTFYSKFNDELIDFDYNDNAPYTIEAYGIIEFAGIGDLQIGTYTFNNKNASAAYDSSNILKNDIANHLFTNMSIAIDYTEYGKIEKTFYQEKYFTVSLNEAFGQTGEKSVTKTALDFGGESAVKKDVTYYTWKNVGAEKATVDVYFDKNLTVINVH